MAAGAFPRLRELVVPFVHLRNSPAGRLADVLARASNSSDRAISSVAIRASRRGHYTLPDRAATASLHDDILRALAHHSGLAQLAIDYLDTDHRCCEAHASCLCYISIEHPGIQRTSPA